MRSIIRFTIPAALALFVATASGETTPNSTRQTSVNQKQLSAEQKNQQSTFDPKRVSDTELKKSVTDLNKASTFMGMPVQNMQNEKLGSVKDLVFDPANGKISYAVVSVGGFLGVGEKLIAVPITSLRAQPGAKNLVLNMTKNELSSAPGLARNDWPDLDDPAFGAPASSQSESKSATQAKTQQKQPDTSSTPPATSDSSTESVSSTSKDQGGAASGTSGSKSSSSEESSKGKDSQQTSTVSTNTPSSSTAKSE